MVSGRVAGWGRVCSRLCDLHPVSALKFRVNEGLKGAGSEPERCRAGGERAGMGMHTRSPGEDGVEALCGLRCTKPRTRYCSAAPIKYTVEGQYVPQQRKCRKGDASPPLPPPPPTPPSDLTRQQERHKEAHDRLRPPPSRRRTGTRPSASRTACCGWHGRRIAGGLQPLQVGVLGRWAPYQRSTDRLVLPLMLLTSSQGTAQLLRHC